MKDIPGFEGDYAITKDCQVWAYEKKWCCGKPKINFTKKAHWVNGRISTNGYRVFKLKKDKKNVHLLAHRAVALTFIPNPNNFPCINHIDCNRLNNKLENLEWCTYKQNSQHMVRLGRNKRGNEHPNAKLRMKSAQKIRNLYKNGGTSYKRLSREFGVSKKTIMNVIHHKIWKEETRL